MHCFSQRQAKFIRHVVEERLREFGLRCHPDKTRIVYCKQHGREEKYPVMAFTFLGFDFRRAPVRRRDGVLMCGFVGSPILIGQHGPARLKESGL
jgi:hypothetical protein